MTVSTPTLQFEFETTEARWQALSQRQPEADGRFFYGVVTTGVYCRPTCSSRLPRRENVRFFADIATAEAEGFRPCKRCQPTAEPFTPHAEAIHRACEQIAHAEQEPTLAELAAEAGLSPYHFQRLFKKMVGVSPKQYAIQQRLEKVRHGLQAEATVTEALYEAGFGSGSRFYQQATAVLGMTPTTYQNGAQEVTIQFATAPSYLGWVLVAATSHGICAIDLGDDPEQLVANLHGRFPHAHFLTEQPEFATHVQQVITFLEAPHRATFSLPLDIQGTAFQRRVWQALQAIPAGQTASYGQIATQLGNPRAMRAVAQACAANALAVAIPCHRVVRGDGSLGGYRWGVERKALLLARERTQE